MFSSIQYKSSYEVIFPNWHKAFICHSASLDDYCMLASATEVAVVTGLATGSNVPTSGIKFTYSIDMKYRGRNAIYGDVATDRVYLLLTEYFGVDATGGTLFV